MKYLCLLSFFLVACTSPPSQAKHSKTEIMKRLVKLNEIIVASTLKKDIDKRLSVFNENPICMSDHQVSMQGIRNLKQYHQSIFARQNLSEYKRTIAEVYLAKNRIIEIGNYKKVGITTANQTPFSHKGKYLNVWTFNQNNELELVIETWNYDHPIEDIKSILVDVPAAKHHGVLDVKNELTSLQLQQLSKTKMNMTKGVQERDGTRRASIYHDDGIFMPHDEPMMIGKRQILEHMIAYNSGNVSIDSLLGGSNWAENLDDFILESSNYYVEWSVENYSGIGRGKGLRLWKKTQDGVQKIVLNIALRDSN